MSARKSLGQNFLLDLNLTRRIAREAGPLDGRTVDRDRPRPRRPDARAARRRRGRVVAIERDARCLPALEEIAAAYPGRLTVVEADALEVDEASLLRNGERAIVVANLPYNVATPLLVKWLTPVDVAALVSRA